MEEMFGVLAANGTVGWLELVMNVHSFSQTVENIFTLSFLVRTYSLCLCIRSVTHAEHCCLNIMVVVRSNALAAQVALSMCAQAPCPDYAQLSSSRVTLKVCLLIMLFMPVLQANLELASAHNMQELSGQWFMHHLGMDHDGM